MAAAATGGQERSDDIVGAAAVAAVFELPRHVWVSPEVLGTATATGVGNLRFEVRTAVPVPGQLTDVVTPPDLPGVPADELVLADKPWVMDFAADLTAPGVALCRIGVVAPLSNNEDLPMLPWQKHADIRQRVEDAFSTGIDMWFDLFRSWVEVVTGQDLDHHHPIYDAVTPGHGLQLWSAHEGFHPPGHLRLTTPKVIPLASHLWSQVLDHVAADREPPPEYLLTRDARAAFSRGNTRRAVIEAAAAVEIVLNELLDDALATLSGPLKESLRKEPRTLGRLVRLMCDAGIDVAATREQLTALTTLRNAAAHRGVAPASIDAVQSVDTATHLVNSRGALARPASRAADE